MIPRWGLLGASKIGRRALAPAMLASGHTLGAVAARDAGRAQDFATEFAIPRAYGSYAELLADDDVDCIYNALTNEAHLPWTLRALEAGKHVLCEKPLALTAADVRQMQAAEQASGKRVMEAFCHVWHPQFARIQAIIAAGEIGRLVGMNTWFSGVLGFDTNDFHWHAQHGGGALYDLGCYCVSIMRALAEAEPIHIAATSQQRNGVDEALSGFLGFPDGVGGSFTCAFAGGPSQSLSVIGDAGQLVMDWPFSTKLRQTHVTVAGRTETFPETDPYAPMVRHFAAAISGEVLMRYDLAWSLRQATTIDALLESAT